LGKATVFYKLPGLRQIVKKTGTINPKLKPITFDKLEKNIFLFSPFNSKNFSYEITLNHSISNFETIGYSTCKNNHFDTEDEFLAKTDKAINTMKNNSNLGKVVLGRVALQNIDNEIDINAYFLSLCINYPNSFVYAVSSAITGTWIAATPEIFLKTNYKTIETIALAGTMLNNSSANWGEKEIDEQNKVALFINEIASKNNLLKISENGPSDLITGHLKHLCTYFLFKYKQGIIANFITQLNPTPAVGGLPKDAAITFIKENENLDRRFYTGFVGIMNREETNLFVNLRCMELFKNKIHLYAGCGITKNSDSKAEWQETENKLSILRKFLP
jgi:isochorismate synthase